MNPEIKKKWVNALRSGKYKQTKGKLYNPEEDAYCCLGVLCEIVDWTGPKEARFQFKLSEAPQSLFDGLMDWYGDEETGEFFRIEDEELSVPILNELGLPGTVQGNLIEMNDDLGRDFDQIADEIETML